jgi:hypothetical protein
VSGSAASTMFVGSRTRIGNRDSALATGNGRARSYASSFDSVMISSGYQSGGVITLELRG